MSYAKLNAKLVIHVRATSYYRGWLCLMATSWQRAHFEISQWFLSALSVFGNKEKLWKSGYTYIHFGTCIASKWSNPWLDMNDNYSSKSRFTHCRAEAWHDAPLIWQDNWLENTIPFYVYFAIHARSASFTIAYAHYSCQSTDLRAFFTLPN